MMDPDWFPLRGLFKLLKTISLTFQILLCQKSESSGMLDKRQFKTWIINYSNLPGVWSLLKNIFKFLLRNFYQQFFFKHQISIIIWSLYVSKCFSFYVFLCSNNRCLGQTFNKNKLSKQNERKKPDGTRRHATLY